jgi:hypothetical protein
MSLLFLFGCIDNEVTAKPDEPAFDEGTDSTPVTTDTADTDDTDLGDSAPPTGDTCADAAPADDVQAILASCSGEITPFTGELVEVWRTSLPQYAAGVHAARLADGNGDGVVDAADPMQVLVDVGWSSVEVFDSDGSALATYVPGSYRVTATTGDIDPTDEGSEGIVSGYFLSGNDYLDVVGDSGTRWSNTVERDASMYPWLTDLEGDGSYEVLAGKHVLDAATGATLATMEGWFSGDVTPAVSADLDRDGTEEIFVADWGAGEVGIYAPDGTALATCVTGAGPIYSASYAVGNLDADDDGELVAAGDGYLAICDADGTQLAFATAFVGGQPALVGIGQFDGDPEAEIIVSEVVGVTVFDSDLTVMWSYRHRGGMWHPFSLADLDGDGLHEVLIHVSGSLVVLDAAGAVLADYPVGSDTGSSWKGQPIVADIDADGLAEIVIGGAYVVVLESPEGGWAIPDAAFDWPGPDRHPGDRTESGGLPGPHAFWLEPGGNVWQGLTPGPGRPAELGVSITELCLESCEGDAVVTVRVANASAENVSRAMTVTLQSIDRGDILGTTTVAAPLPAETGRYVTFRVPADRVAEGLRAIVDGDNRVQECDEVANEDEYRDTICP